MKYPRTLFTILSIIMIGLLIAGCGGKAEPAASTGGAAPAQAPAKAEEAKVQASRIIKHELGETEIKGTPKRIVALEFSYVDSLAALGIAPVGIADDNDPKLVIEPVKKKIGSYTSVGSRYETNLELVSSLQPDLIIADISRHKEVYEKLKKIAPTIVLNSLGAGYKENLASFPIIAEAVGEGEKAKKLLADHQAKLEELKKNIPQGEKRTVLPAVVGANGFFGHSNKSYGGSLLEHLGLKDAVQSNEAYPKMTLEQLVQADPDVIFFMKSSDKTVLDEWKSNPLWSNLKAVKSGSVFEVQRNMWSLSRGLIAAESIAGEAIQLLYKGNK
ncbi:MAG: transporter substrate-binding protein [Paenibacillus sp.]|jgi:iron complex transport system substrate-binding protein|nr:transporter substrate-binding protein [Paenibacillus sp.]